MKSSTILLLIAAIALCVDIVGLIINDSGMMLTTETIILIAAHHICIAIEGKS